MTGGTLTNVGTVSGGNFGIDGGVGLVATAGTVDNTANGLIAGAGGATGVVFAGATFTNAGQITGGAGYYEAGGGSQASGVGLELQSGALTNTGSITGGYGVLGGDSSGGTGVSVSAGASVINNGTITGGGDSTGAPGGTGVYLSGGSLSNAGTITGGAVNEFDGIPEASPGGVGVIVSGPVNVTNSATGTISGGAGYPGSPGNSGGYPGGEGGTGIELFGSAALTNSGDVTGGRGGAGVNGGNGGAGGAAAYLSGATLTNAGTISGGAGGLGGAGSGGAAGGTAGANGAAVQFGPAAATLVDEPGGVFNGQVTANTTVNDILELEGTQTAAGTPITLGTQFTGFSTLTFAPGAQWTVDATTASLTSHAPAIDGFALGDVLDVTDLAPGATATFNTTTDVLTVKDGSTSFSLDFNSAFAGDTFVLTAAGAGTDIALHEAACYLEGTQIRTEEGERARP
jgi:hypothetical protein